MCDLLEHIENMYFTRLETIPFREPSNSAKDIETFLYEFDRDI